MASLSKESEQCFKEFAEKTKKYLFACVIANKDRFHNAEKLLNRYHDVVSRVLKQRLTTLREFHEVHNELCMAAVILEDKSEPNVTNLEYEPKIDGCDKRFDFHAVMKWTPSQGQFFSKLRCASFCLLAIKCPLLCAVFPCHFS